MTAAATSLHVARLHIVAATVVIALVAALFALWPTPRRGLVLYVTSDGAAALARAFSRESGVHVTVVRLSAGPMLARIAAEADRPGWALAWVDGDIAAAALDRAGLLEHGIVPATPGWTATGRALIPANGAWVPTGVTLAGVIVAQAQATGPLGMPDPAISGPAFPQIAGLIAQHGGWPRGQRALLAMRAAELSVAPTSPAVIEELRAGRIGHALIQSSTAYAIGARDPALRIRMPHTAVLMPGVLMMAKGLPHGSRRDADRFVSFLLSPRAHALRLAGGTATEPVRGARPPHTLYASNYRENAPESGRWSFFFDTTYRFPEDTFEYLASHFPALHFDCGCIDSMDDYMGYGWFNVPQGGEPFRQDFAVPENYWTSGDGYKRTPPERVTHEAVAEKLVQAARVRDQSLI